MTLSTRHKSILKRWLFYSSLLFSNQVTLAQGTPNVIVAQDGSGNFRTVQAAIDAAPAVPYIIYIKNGKYKGKVNVPATKPFLQLVGESVGGVTLTYDDYAGKLNPVGGAFSATNAASMTVESTDFSAFNITFENSASADPNLYALALNISGDRGVFRNCRFLGGQTTVYTSASGTRQYFRNCFIQGNTDFIFGSSTAVFDQCVIYPKTRSDKGNLGYITAASTPAEQAYGYVFRDCIIPTNQGSTIYILGRAWQNDASTTADAKANNKVAFLKSRLGAGIIKPEGWSVWDAGTNVTLINYSEYKSRSFRGNLENVNQRVSWSKQLAATDTSRYQTTTVLSNWNPCTVDNTMCAAFTPSIATANFLSDKSATALSFTWNASWATAQVRYDLMRSSTRKGTYTSVSQITSPNDTTYNFRTTDVPPASNSNYFYYLRSTKAGLDTHISDTLDITAPLFSKSDTALQAYPNPATYELTVLHTMSVTNAVLTVISIDGRQVFSMHPTAGNLKTHLPIGHLVSGIYLLRYTDDKRTLFTKFTKQ